MRDRHHGDRRCAGASRARAGARTGWRRLRPGRRTRDRLSIATARHARRQARPNASSASPGRTSIAFEPQPRLRRVVRGQHAGRQRRFVVDRRRRRASARPSAALDLARATGRRDAAASASPRQRDDGRTPRRRWSARRRRSDRCVRRGRPRRARRSSARHGRIGWPTARRPACRSARRIVARDRMVAARAPRSCRGRRSRGRETGQPGAFGSTSVSGPGQNAASRSASALNTASRRAAATSATCAISGLKRRPALGGIEPRDRRRHSSHRRRGRRPSRSGTRRGRRRRARARPPRSHRDRRSSTRVAS